MALYYCPGSRFDLGIGGIQETIQPLRIIYYTCKYCNLIGQINLLTNLLRGLEYIYVSLHGPFCHSRSIDLSYCHSNGCLVIL